MLPCIRCTTVSPPPRTSSRTPAIGCTKKPAAAKTASTAKKTGASTKKPAASAKKPEASAKKDDFALTAAEKKLVELYREADADTKKKAVAVLKGELEAKLPDWEIIVGTNEAIELVNFEGVLSAFHEIARLVDKAWLTELHQVLCLVERDLLFKLVTAQSAIRRGPFNSKVPARVTDAHTNGASVTAADIALTDAATGKCLLFVARVFDQEFSLDLESAHLVSRNDKDGIDHECQGEQNQHAKDPIHDFLTFVFYFLLISHLLLGRL